MKVELYRQAYLGMMKRGVKVRAITEITNENIQYCKDLISLGIVSDLRHMDGVKGNFAVTDTEYIASSNLTEASPSFQIIRSNDPEIKSQNLFVFETLWSRATPAANRILELEQGTEVEETTLVTDFAELYRLGSQAIDELKDEVLIVLASEKTISRNQEMFEKISKLQKERGFKIRVLVNSNSNQPPSGALSILDKAEWRSLEWSGQLTIMVFDRRRMFITQYVDLFGNTLQDAVMSNIYTTNKQMIEGIASFYDALWSESWLRSKEERSRIQAQLMQDILAHDIRNHNQVARLNAEILLTELQKSGQKKSSSDIESMISAILDSIDRSTSLVDRATKLGKIIAQGGNATLFSTSLGQAISNAFDIVAKSYSQNSKQLDVKVENFLKNSRQSDAENQIADLNNVYVLADELLELVFSNLFSNAVKYSSSSTEEGKSDNARQIVPVELRIEAVTESPVPTPGNGWEENSIPEKRRHQSAASSSLFYRISIIDQGNGIPDEHKKELFTRYLKRARGSGLGLSIVHALVVERYRGKMRVKNRVEGDYKQGTVFEILLPKAFPLN